MSETVKEGIHLTDSAINKLKVLLETEEAAQDLRLRLYVEPGGCSGLRYDFFMEDTVMRQRFVIDNPNAQGTCACGDSFN